MTDESYEIIGPGSFDSVKEEIEERNLRLPEAKDILSILADNIVGMGKITEKFIEFGSHKASLEDLQAYLPEISFFYNLMRNSEEGLFSYTQSMWAMHGGVLCADRDSKLRKPRQGDSIDIRSLEFSIGYDSFPNVHGLNSRRNLSEKKIRCGYRTIGASVSSSTDMITSKDGKQRFIHARDVFLGWKSPLFEIRTDPLLIALAGEDSVNETGKMWETPKYSNLGFPNLLNSVDSYFLEGFDIHRNAGPLSGAYSPGCYIAFIRGIIRPTLNVCFLHEGQTNRTKTSCGTREVRGYSFGMKDKIND